MPSLDRYHLVDNPFPITPRTDRLIWADRSRFKEDILRSLTFSFSTTPSRIIACIYGDYGAGKTHAMRYFSREETIRGIVSSDEIAKARIPIVVPVVYPKRDVVKSLYLEIIKDIGLDRIRAAVRYFVKPTELVTHMDASAQTLQEIINDEYLSRALAKIDDKKIPVERYLLSKVSPSEQRMLGVPRSIETYDEQVRALCGILRLLTSTIASRVVLWIDDVERIGDGSGKDMFDFRYFIRDLLDRVPEKLVIIMNLTLTPKDDLGDRLSLLGDAIVRRISRTLTIGTFVREEFLPYIVELLNEYRMKDFNQSKLPEIYPFTKECLDFIFDELSKLNRLTPRDVNIALATLLELAVVEIDEQVSDSITLDYAIQKKGELFGIQV